MPLTEVARRPASEREQRIAFHNLLTSVEEVGRVRQAIRDGTLWELAERRASGHPALRAGLDEAKRHPEVFLPTEPEARRAFREITPESRQRPSVVRFRRRVEVYARDLPLPERVSRYPFAPSTGRIPTRDRTGRPISWRCDTPLGFVPLELTDLYPVGPFLGVDEFADPPRHRPPSMVAGELRERAGLDADLDRDWTEEWTQRQVRALLAFEYGAVVADAVGETVRGERSRRTGRLRAIVADGKPWFVVGTDGLPRPTFFGASRLAPLLSEGRSRVVVSDDAVPFVSRGRSLFARFVTGADPALVPDRNGPAGGPERRASRRGAIAPRAPRDGALPARGGGARYGARRGPRVGRGGGRSGVSRGITAK